MIILSSSADPFLLRSDGNNIFTASLDGTVHSYLTADGPGYYNGIAAWSRDGSKIVYSRQAPNTPSYIWTMNADGSDKKQLTFGSLTGGEASFSPDGNSILFTGTATGHSELWLMSADGAAPRMLTNTTGTQVTWAGATIQWAVNGTYSPDGTRLAFASTQSGRSEIWVMNADGSDQKQLTFPDDPNAPDANGPAWSPDGTKIAFYGGFATEHGNIYTIDTDGSQRTQLTFEPATMNSDGPAWSPDGKSILFVSSRDNLSRTWIMDADGTNQRVLFSGGYGEGRQPIHDHGFTDQAILGAPGDQITGGSGITVIDGSAGQQTISGGSGQSMIIGGPNDVIFGSSGAGTSAISGAPVDALMGGYGWDWIDGAAGWQAITGGPGHSTIVGGTGDVIFGSTTSSGTCWIAGVQGDAIMGGSGNDGIGGQAGNQPITGGSGNTIVWAGAGDTVFGGSGNLTVNIDHSQFTGAVSIKDTGVQGYDTVVGFSQSAGDRLSFPNETAAAIDSVVGSAHINNGNTILTLPDGATVTLVGITHIDSSFFA